MKKYLYLAAALAFVGAVSCNKELVDNNTPEVPEAKLSTLTATIGEPGTKTSLATPENAHVNGSKTYWCAEDAIGVFDGERNVQYTIQDKDNYEAADNATFEGNKLADAVSYLALYPYTATAELADGVIKGAVLPAEQTAVKGNIPEGAALAVAYSDNPSSFSFKNVATTIGFTLTEAATKVEFVAKGGESIAGTIDITYNGDADPTYTVQAEKGNNTVTLNNLAAGTYYFTILPDVTLSQGYELKIDGYTARTGAVGATLERSKIYSLETQIVPVGGADIWGVCGTFTNGWDIAENIQMKAFSDGWYQLTDVTIYKDDEFKLVTNNSWTGSLGADGSVLTADESTEYTLVGDGKNIKVKKNGKFTIRLNPTEKKFTVACTEEFTDLTVQITIKNERSWSSVNAYFWVENGDSDVDITTSPGPSLSKDAEGNYVYEIDGQYIGQNIGYIFSDNGSDATDADYMIISQNGNNLTISSIPPAKFTFLLDTTTLTTYWGTTAYLYVWTDAPKVEPLGTWPGKQMTYDSATKSFTSDIPAEYIGKKLNFIVHNNSGWQCADNAMNPVKSEQTYKGNADLGLN